MSNEALFHGDVDLVHRVAVGLVGDGADLPVEWKPRHVDGAVRLGVEEQRPPDAPAVVVDDQRVRLGRQVREHLSPGTGRTEQSKNENCL